MERSLVDFHRLVAQFEASVAATGLGDEDRYNLFKNVDPYPKIQRSLLNAGHIASYAVALGMIEPFDRKALTKPATYLIPAEGPCRYRDEDGRVQRFYLSADPLKRGTELEVREQIRLAPNSVCFVTLAPFFRLPSYIGARFNLLIRDVYRGLLVGTGPLVDPGFTGRLSIPIHNFTSKEYFIRAGDGLLYFEFTKLTWTNPSPKPANPAWLPPPVHDQPPFPASKARRKSLDDYLDEATGGGPPQNAIGEQIQTVTKQAQNARRLLALYSFGGLVAVVGLFLTGWSLYASAQQFVAAAQTELRASHQKVSEDLKITRSDVQELRAALEKERRERTSGKAGSASAVVPAP